jgi:phosphinothricin acetyltransferase
MLAALPRGVQLRDATAADSAAIATIWNAEILDADTTTDTEPRPVATVRAWLTGRSADHPVVVASEGHAVLAWGALSPYRDRPAFARTVEDSVYVATAHRGRGLGRRILAELIRRAAARGHHSILARVTAGNAASLGLHRQLGFRVIGVERETAFTRGRWLDVVLLQRRLDGR